MATTTPTRTRPDRTTGGTDPHLRQRLDAIEREVGELRRGQDRIVALLEVLVSRGGPRDGADAAVLPAIADAVQGRRFTSAELLDSARVNDGGLARALEDADVTNTRELGRLLGRLEGREIGGLWLAHIDDCRAGAVWQVQVSRV